MPVGIGRLISLHAERAKGSEVGERADCTFRSSHIIKIAGQAGDQLAQEDM